MFIKFHWKKKYSSNKLSATEFWIILNTFHKNEKYMSKPSLINQGLLFNPLWIMIECPLTKAFCLTLLG